MLNAFEALSSRSIAAESTGMNRVDVSGESESKRRMATMISFFNLKGGFGKTSLLVNVASFFGLFGQKRFSWSISMLKEISVSG